MKYAAGAQSCNHWNSANPNYASKLHEALFGHLRMEICLIDFHAPLIHVCSPVSVAGTGVRAAAVAGTAAAAEAAAHAAETGLTFHDGLG